MSKTQQILEYKDFKVFAERIRKNLPNEELSDASVAKIIYLSLVGIAGADIGEFHAKHADLYSFLIDEQLRTGQELLLTIEEQSDLMKAIGVRHTRIGTIVNPNYGTATKESIEVDQNVLHFVCFVCSKPTKLQCPCKKTYYCSSQCQIKDIQNHKKICTNKKRKESPFQMNMMRFDVAPMEPTPESIFGRLS